MNANLFATTLYKLVHNDKTIKVSDNLQMLKSDDPDDVIVSIPSVKDYQPDEFTIIENGENKEYGLSEIFEKDDTGYDITLYNCYMNSEGFTNYHDCVEKFREDFGSKSSWADELSYIGSINKHIEWWTQASKKISDAPPIFLLSDEEIILLLQTGFEAERVILIDDDIKIWQLKTPLTKAEATKYIYEINNGTSCSIENYTFEPVSGHTQIKDNITNEMSNMTFDSFQHMLLDNRPVIERIIR